jgi:hypothetical protein
MKRSETYWCSSEIRKVQIKCVCGGVYKKKGTSKRETSTRLTGCPWISNITRVRRGLDKWTTSVVCAEHNHDPLIDPVIGKLLFGN